MSCKSCLLVLLLLIPALTTLSAQKEETILGERGWGLSGLWGGYAHQLTQYDDQEAFNSGGFFGFEFGKSLTLGWSHTRLRDEVQLRNNETRQFDFRYNGGKIGYAFIPYKALHPVLNFEIGTGRAKLSGEGEDKVLVMQPSAGLEINIFRWFRLGVEGGYRLVQNGDLTGITASQMSGPFGQASLKFGLSWGRYHKSKEPVKKKYEN